MSLFCTLTFNLALQVTTIGSTHAQGILNTPLQTNPERV